MDVSILSATPIVLGVLTCTDEKQAVKRSTGDNNHGVGWGEPLGVQNVTPLKKLAVKKLRLGFSHTA